MAYVLRKRTKEDVEFFGRKSSYLNCAVIDNSSLMLYNYANKEFTEVKNGRY